MLDACEALGIRPVDAMEAIVPTSVKAADMNMSAAIGESRVAEMTEQDGIEAAMEVAEATQSAIDPELVAAVAEYVAKAIDYHVYRGVRKVKQIARLMIEENGLDRFKQYMQRPFRSVYNQVRGRYEDEPWVDEMTLADRVRPELQEAIEETEAAEAATETTPEEARDAIREKAGGEPGSSAEGPQEAEVVSGPRGEGEPAHGGEGAATDRGGSQSDEGRPGDSGISGSAGVYGAEDADEAEGSTRPSEVRGNVERGEIPGDRNAGRTDGAEAAEGENTLRPAGADRGRSDVADTAEKGGDESEQRVAQEGTLPLYETEGLGWADVKGFFEEYGCVVVGDPELRWYEESWGVLMKSGLADATGSRLDELEHRRITLKLRVICLLAMYLGICQEAGEFSPLGGYFSGHHPFSWYLDSLKVEKEDLWEMAHMEGFIETDSPNYWEDEDTSDEDLESFAIALVEYENPSICQALREHYGGDRGLFVSVWNSRLPLESLDDPWSSAYRDAKKLNPSQFVESAYGGDGESEIWEYVRRGMSSWTLLDS